MSENSTDFKKFLSGISDSIPSDASAEELAELGFMREALAEAVKAFEIDEVPIGCVIVRNGEIISRSHNMRELTNDPTGHAEILAIQHASKLLNSWRLDDCEVYVTLEPCIMCTGALLQARVKRVIFGAFDPKAGATGTLYNLHADERLNHRFPVKSGVLEKESVFLLQEFFKRKRKNSNGTKS